MPLYFFNRMDGEVEIDREGTELADLDTAREEAIIFLGQSIKDHPGMLKNTGELRVEVTGEDGALMTTVIVHALDPVAPDTIAKAIKG